MPSAEIREKYLVEVGSAKSNIGGTRDHCSGRIIGYQLSFAPLGHFVYVVGGVTSDEEITGGVKRQAVWNARQMGCIDSRLRRAAIRPNLDLEHIVARALHHIQKAIVRAERQPVGESERTSKHLDLLVRP